MPVILVEIVSHLLISGLIAVILWPYGGAASLIVVLSAIALLVRAWRNADLIVAAKAGFRPPTLVQQRYLEYMDTGQEVFTHPSLLPIAGILASSKRRLVLLTSGVINELSENDLRQLIAELSSRESREVFGWTFHLATGCAGLFAKAGRGDPFAQSWAEWSRKILLVGGIGGAAAVVMAVVIAAPLSLMYRHQIDISPIVPVFWMPFIYLGMRFLWRRGNAALIKPAAGNWNTRVNVDEAIFVPMTVPAGGHSNLNLVRHGLLIEEKMSPAVAIGPPLSRQRQI